MLLKMRCAAPAVTAVPLGSSRFSEVEGLGRGIYREAKTVQQSDSPRNDGCSCQTSLSGTKTVASISIEDAFLSEETQSSPE